MTKNKRFSIIRFINLLKREFHINIKRDFLIIGAMYSIFTIIAFVTFEFGENKVREEILEKFHFIVYTVMLFVGGIFITSFSFIELRDKLKSHFYLLTPGSTFEKFLVNIFISFIGYMVFMIITYVPYSMAFNWATFHLYNLQYGPLNLASTDFKNATQVFIMVHSFFFLGAITFKKYPIILTPIAGFLIIGGLSMVNQAIKKIVFANVDLENHFIQKGIEDLFTQYETITQIGFFYILPIILWYVAYLKLNEKEY